jgi:hypothetical protein
MDLKSAECDLSILRSLISSKPGLQTFSLPVAGEIGETVLAGWGKNCLNY